MWKRMELRKVLSNRDPLKVGRVLTEDGWLHPISRSEEVWVPAEDTYVVSADGFYIAGEAKPEDQPSLP